ncbi:MULTISPECIES: hypothetical protein [Geobacillus]|uniref:Chromosome partition protein smc n=1 Tax=Geobacillus proteiniphilus TaxID=860353 RepID=A0ABY9MIC9_9BACL|nr:MULTISPECIES: hypothetical protein [Geobacillus]AKM18193.1 hypothetical protein GARCT_00897 [Geobacillus sp. 12AMOR1]MDF9296405.1 hypothetical protein [Geobacillus stearothermophilus]MED3667703.1 hypothetical protein [Geobacillus kaustophilus]OPX01672.1 hypothetical protein B1A75_15410 [Geobacillus sp. LEMMY01]WMJ17792.1 hypothetical protein RA955_07060 [Geobacillus proteiniphilus]
MERDTVVKEVVEALKIFSRDIRTQIDEMGSQLRAEIQDTANQLRAEMQQFRAEVNERFDRLEQKFAGLRVELTETQETVHFLASKTIQHEKKLHHLAKQLEFIR